MNESDSQRVDSASDSQRVDAASQVRPLQNPRQHSDGQQAAISAAGPDRSGLRHDTLAEREPKVSGKTSLKAKTKTAVKSLKSTLSGAVSIPVSGMASMFGSSSQRLGRVAASLADVETVDGSGESVVLHATDERSSARPIANVTRFSPVLPSHDLQRDRGTATDHLWKGTISNLDALRIDSGPLEHQRASDSAQRRRQDQYMRSSADIRSPRRESQEHFPQPRSPRILNQDGPFVTASARNRHTKAMQLQSVSSSRGPFHGEPHPGSQPSRRGLPESQQSRSRGRGSQGRGAHNQYRIPWSPPASGGSWKRGRQYMHVDSIPEEAEGASTQQVDPPRPPDIANAMLDEVYAWAEEATSARRPPPTMHSLASSQSPQPQRVSHQAEMEPIPGTSDEHQQPSVQSKPWEPLRLN